MNDVLASILMRMRFFPPPMYDKGVLIVSDEIITTIEKESDVPYIKGISNLFGYKIIVDSTLKTNQFILGSIYEIKQEETE